MSPRIVEHEQDDACRTRFGLPRQGFEQSLEKFLRHEPSLRDVASLHQLADMADPHARRVEANADTVFRAIEASAIRLRQDELFDRGARQRLRDQVTDERGRARHCRLGNGGCR
jgi:hypothetical protein